MKGGSQGVQECHLPVVIGCSAWKDIYANMVLRLRPLLVLCGEHVVEQWPCWSCPCSLTCDVGVSHERMHTQGQSRWTDPRPPSQPGPGQTC